MRCGSTRIGDFSKQLSYGSFAFRNDPQLVCSSLVVAFLQRVSAGYTDNMLIIERFNRECASMLNDWKSLSAGSIFQDSLFALSRQSSDIDQLSTIVEQLSLRDAQFELANHTAGDAHYCCKCVLVLSIVDSQHATDHSCIYSCAVNDCPSTADHFCSDESSLFCCDHGQQWPAIEVNHSCSVDSSTDSLANIGSSVDSITTSPVSEQRSSNSP
ncbi:hypothetical protein MP228_004541 [Amoeboaphelidium protococcarum]|nr:hypothetical protein MP228_004541 [Amoeboaphelidium protococcarum]